MKRTPFIECVLRDIKKTIIYMKRILVISISILIHVSIIYAETYYVDPDNGNDGNNGTTKQTAWKSLLKVNSGTFMPGDSILLRAGSVFNDQQLELTKNSGANDRLIVVASFGEGEKPVINGNGKALYSISIRNIEYCTVKDLEITNTGATREAGRIGVKIVADNCGDMHNITVQNITIRNVNGSLVKSEGSGGGIYWNNLGNTLKSRFINLHILDCHIKDCGRNGIYADGYYSRDKWYPSLGVVIRGNLIEGVPGDGIVPMACDGALIENNVMRDCPDILPSSDGAAGIWPWSCDNTVIQYNDVSGQNAHWDGQGFDSDYNCNNTTIQYNYSHDNAGGFLLICTDGSSLGQNWNKGTNNTIVRYNISVNDGIRTYQTSAGWFSPIFHISGPTNNTMIYNNLIYVEPKTNSNIDRSLVRMGNWGGYSRSTYFYNNIFYVENGEQMDFKFAGDVGTVFLNNAYIGSISGISRTETQAKYADPKFSGKLVSHSKAEILDRLRLEDSSPYLFNGITVENDPRIDFWGTRLKDGDPVSIGPYYFEPGTFIKQQQMMKGISVKSDSMNGSFTISYSNGFESKPSLIEVFNTNGKTIHSSKNNAQNFMTINLKGKVVSGIYLIRITSNGYQFTDKIFIKLKN